MAINLSPFLQIWTIWSPSNASQNYNSWY